MRNRAWRATAFEVAVVVGMASMASCVVFGMVLPAVRAFVHRLK